VTILPNPYSNCRPQYYPNIFATAWDVILLQESTCFDLFFSGHTVTVWLYCLMNIRYSRYFVLKLVSIPMMVIFPLILVSTRFHYSVDVTYAAVIAFFTFVLYHFIIDEIQMRLIEGSGSNQGPRRSVLDLGWYNESNIFIQGMVLFIIWFESFGRFIKNPQVQTV
jgi:hypothetical protein